MKKSTLLISIALTGMLFAACHNNGKANSDVDGNNVAVEEPTEKAGRTISSGSHNGSSTNWDKALDEYERYVDRCIAFLKKVNDGDVGAMSEYMEMHETAERFMAQMENADSMTPEQIARYVSINKKMATAAATMQKTASSQSRNADAWQDDEEDDDEDNYDWF